MNRKLSARPVWALGLLLGATTAAFAAGPGASGTCTYKTNTITIKDGYLYQEKDPFDATKKRTKIALSSKPFDSAKLAAAKDVDHELTQQAFGAEGSQVQLTLGDGGVTALYVYVYPGTNLSTSGSAMGELKFTRNDAKGAAGTFHLAAKDADSVGCTVSFDLAFVTARPAPAGKPLGPGGGEPGKAYLAYVAAMKKGDVDTLAKLMPKERADAMLAHRKDPQFAQQLGFLQAMAPSTVAVTGGSETTGGAELQVEGKDATGNRIDGTVTMKLDSGAWRVDKEDLTTHTK